MTKILKTAKFSISHLNGGSVSSREKLVNKLENNFYNLIKDEFTHKDVSFDTVKKTYYKVIPKKSEIIVQPKESSYSSKVYGSVFLGANKKGNVAGYIVQVLPNFCTKKLSIQEFGTLMHESNHLFTYMVNPKFVSRIVSLHDKGYINSEILAFFDNHIQKYSNKKDLIDLPKFLEKLLENKTSDEKINLLQNYRYRIISELSAYKSGNKYQKKIEAYFPDKLSQKSSLEKIYKFRFQEKLKIITDYLMLEIEKVRKYNSKIVNRQI